MANPYQKFAKDVLIYGAATVLIQLGGLISVPIITKTLGTNDYGIWVQVQITIALTLILTQLGLTAGMIRFLPTQTNKAEIREEFYSVLSIIAIASLIISVVFIVFADFIAASFFGGLTEIVRVTGMIILAYSLNDAFLALFRASLQIKRYSLFTVVSSYLQIGLIAYLALNGYGILSVVLAFLSVQVLQLVTLFFVTRAQIGICRPHFQKLQEYFSFSLPIIPMSIASWVTTSSDRYVIAYFLDTTAVGIYSSAYALGNIILLFAGMVGFILPQTVYRLFDEGRTSDAKIHLSYSLKYILAVAIPFVFGSAVLAEPALRILSNPEIASSGHFIMPLIALGNLFVCVNSVICIVLGLVKKMKLIGTIYVTAAVINLGLNILLVPHLGIMGAAITSLTTSAVILGITTYYSLKEFTFDIDWLFIIKSLVASVVMSLAVWLIHPQSILPTIIAVILGVTIYGIVLLLFKGFKKDEIKFFKELAGIGKASSQ